MPFKKNLETTQMTTVDVASTYARKLVDREMMGSSDTEGAMRRIEAKYGLGYWTLWSFRYKPPKSVTAEIYQRLRAAYLASCERHLASVSHELAVEQSKGGSDDLSDLVAEAEALVAKIKAAQEALK